MSLTVVKYRKTTECNTPLSSTVMFQRKSPMQQEPLKKFDIIQTNTSDGATRVVSGVINKLPTILDLGMKRITTTATVSAPLLKVPKYGTGIVSATTSSISSTPLSTFKKDQLGAAISSLPPNTIIKATTRPANTANNNANQSINSFMPSVGSVTSPVRQAVFIRRETPSMRSQTLNLLDTNPLVHLGIPPDRMELLKRTVCPSANVTFLDLCITLKKLRLNESSAVLGTYFELDDSSIDEAFMRTIVKLSRLLRHLICWPDSKRHYERLKYVPFAYRRNLLHVQSLIECVETNIDETLNFACASYKYILCINTNGIISYVSEAYRGDCDDLQLFEATDFKSAIPKYLTLFSEPGKAVPRRRKDGAVGDADAQSDEEDAAPEEDNKPLSKYDEQRLTGQLASMQTLQVEDGALTSTRAKHVRVPTLHIHEALYRSQMRDKIDTLREFKILSHCGLHQASYLSYINEILIVVAALCNLKQ